ncbi:DUF6686 family protein [Flagellimonas sp. S174]|uniref:DUF6686 family protein n=1 Tax=Flagellimonas sp. S174 TaxID=3410790 RepID=UPI003BF5DD63
MCTALKFLNQTKNGHFTFCDNSKLFQITFNNLCFEFYEWELENFKSYIAALMKTKWDSPHKDTFRSKKVPISVGNKYFVILVSEEELFELDALLNLETKKIPILHAKDINYRFIEN